MATAYDTANIIIPQGAEYNAGTLFGYSPASSPAALVEFDVTRAGGTATRVNSSGNIESVAANVPRWDWAEGGSCPSLLVEPQRTNVYRNSIAAGSTNGVIGSGGAFPSNGWAYAFGTGGLSTEIIGTGTESGIEYIDIRFFGTASAANVNIYFDNLAAAAASGESWVSSVYLKLVSGTLPNTTAIRTQGRQSGSLTETFTSLDLGVNSNLTRYSYLNTFALGTTNEIVSGIYFNYTVSSSYDFTIRIGLPQLEKGDYLTSVIKTSGSVETRNADAIEKTSIASLLGDSEGSLTIEAAIFEISTGTPTLIQVTEPTLNRNLVSVYKVSTPTGNIGLLSRNNSSLQVLTSTGISFTPNTYFKISVRYATNDFAICVNGGSVNKDTSASTNWNNGGVPIDLSVVNFGTSPNAFFGRIRAFSVYDYAFTDTEMQNITT